MITVAHFRSSYLPLSETFIYNYVANGRRVRNIVVTQERLPTAVHFPLRHLYCTSDPDVRWTWPWLRALLDRHPYARYPVARVLRRHRARLIHAHFGYEGCGALEWARILGLPLVTSFYGFDVTRRSFVEAWFGRYQELFEQGELFLVEGSCMRQTALDLGCPPQKLALQRIAVDVRRIPFRERTLGRGEPVRLLFCARFVEKKGLEYALRAVAGVLAIGIQVQLRVIGDGPLRPQVEQLIGELGITPNVHLAGYVPYESLQDELLACHLLIAPSVTAADGESEGGAPTILLDAQASGLPVLSTTHADIPEVVLDGESGYLVPERDTAALTEQLAFLCSHPECWPGMGLAGRAHIEAHHDIAVLVPHLEEKYFGLLGRRR